MMGNSVSDIGKSIYETITGAHEDRLPLSESLNSNIQNSKINLYENKMRALLAKHSREQIIDSIVQSTRTNPSLWGFLKTSLETLPEAQDPIPDQTSFSDSQKHDLLAQIHLLNQKLTQSDISRENANAQYGQTELNWSDAYESVQRDLVEACSEVDRLKVELSNKLDDLEKSEKGLKDVTDSYKRKLKEMEDQDRDLGEAKDGLLQSVSQLKWIKDE